LTLNKRASEDDRRAFMCVDWIVRTWLPAWLEACGDRYAAHVAALRSAPEIGSSQGLIDVKPIIADAQDDVQDAAWKLWAAEHDAAKSAVLDVARAAAWDAARVASMAASMAAEMDVAGDVAVDAVGVAAINETSPVVQRLQQSAAELVRRMCELKAG